MCHPFLSKQQLRFGGKAQVDALFDRVEVGLGECEILLGRSNGSLRGVKGIEGALSAEDDVLNRLG